MSKARSDALSSSARAAIEWHVRLDNDVPNDDTLAEFDQWRNAAPANADAWQRLQIKVGALRRLERSDVDPVAASAALRLSSPRRRKFALGGASLAVLLATGTLVFREQKLSASVTSLQSGIGKTATYAFDDGAGVLLDASTRVTASKTFWSDRTIAMEQGQLVTQSGSSGTAPISVVSGGLTVECGHANVSVGCFSDHLIVGVRGGDAVATTAVGRFRLARAGAYRVDAQTVKRLPETADEVFAWTQGQLVVIDRAMSDIAEVLSRYRTGVVALAPRLVNRPVSGVFLLKDPERAVRQLAEAAGAHIQRAQGDRITLI
jgi:transmembrane sensor